jgi:hypothetical protein
MFYSEDSPDIILFTYTLEFLRYSLDIRNINRAQRLILFFLVPSILRSNNGIDETLRIIIKLKVTIQNVDLQKPFLFVLTNSGSAIEKIMYN